MVFSRMKQKITISQKETMVNDEFIHFHQILSNFALVDKKSHYHCYLPARETLTL
jgi:hypothetical protein